MYQARPIVCRTIPQAARSVRAAGRSQFRCQSSSSASSANNGSSFSSLLGAGVAGGVISGLLLYSVHSMTPAGKTQKTINKAARQANEKYQIAAKKLQENTPSADQALDSIKQFAYTYLGWVPGGRAFVDTAFKDIETVRENHHDEVDKIVNDTYKQLQGVAKSGLSMETPSKAYEVLADFSKKTANLAGDAFSDVLDNHPDLKEKLGDNVDQLKQLGEQYGPEAKKQVDETWRQIRDVVAGGLSASNLDKARKILEEKVEQVKKLGEKAWDKGLEEAKPFLDKNPKVKDLVEKNADKLMHGNAKEVFDKAKKAAESGDLGDLESYVNRAVGKAKSKASDLPGNVGDLSQYAKMIPGGEEILPKLQELQKVAEKHKDEGEKLLNDTMKDLKSVLDQRSKEAKDIYEKAKKESR